jgi:serine/threonine protein phosphatase PrpC
MTDLQPSSGDAHVNPDDAAVVPLSEAHPHLSVRSFGLTDVGTVRTTNQDQFLIAVLRKTLQIEQTSLPQRTVQHSPDRSHLFVVADGMTHDHTLVEEMVRNGTVAIEDAAKHRLRHVITNVVGGGSANLSVEVHSMDRQMS